MTVKEIKAGMRLRSSVDGAEVIVVRAPSGPVALSCGGAPMVTPDGAASAVGAPTGEPLAIGKRYVDEESGIEVLITKAGAGPLEIDDRPLELKAAKALPASD